nr:glucosamine [Mimivirus sp.]
MFVSELSGFDEDITEYAVICDGDFGYLTVFEDQCNLVSKNNYTCLQLSKSSIVTSPAPYNHWTIKEINDQSIALNNLILSRFDFNKPYFPELEISREELQSIDHIIFLGCGTSYHAAQLGVKFFKEFRTNATIEVIDGADFEENDIPLNRKTILILLSQSGETKDLYRALEIGKQKILNQSVLLM